MKERTAYPDYGIDAPGLVRFFILSGLISTGLAGLTSLWISGPPAWGAIVLAVTFGLAALYLLGMCCIMLYWSKVTKLHTREALLDRIPWRGDERVLDVGCGRGLMAVGAARRLTSGRAIGIDIWRSVDQSSNTAEGALENARRESVVDRVSIQTADMRRLPFEDGSFDVVLSHWAVHNLESETGRKTALTEMTRVLRPGGTLILADIEHRAAYASELSDLGLARQTLVLEPIRDFVLSILSFGSFRPFAIVARR
jgi:ubiquinone/menaquinone biosynthesis C-methylase UbiE